MALQQTLGPNPALAAEGDCLRSQRNLKTGARSGFAQPSSNPMNANARS
jgi:hypothetical protein